MKANHEKYWHETFIFAVIVKSFTGLMELFSGILLLAVTSEGLQKILAAVARGEATEQPQDFFYTYAHQYIAHITSGTRIFAGLYLLSRAIINLLLVVGMVKKKTQAYLIAIGVISVFMLYQLLRIAHTRSLALSALTVFDAFFILLIWHEYKYLSGKLLEN